jgi:predicted ester cyclase
MTGRHKGIASGRSRVRPAVIDRMLALWNGGDVDAIDEIYAPEYVEEVREEIVQLRRAFPDQRFDVERELVADGVVVLCLHWHGTHHGPFASPLGVIAPTGRRFSVRGIEIFDVRDDRVVGIRMGWDLATLVAQLS